MATDFLSLLQAVSISPRAVLKAVVHHFTMPQVSPCWAVPVEAVFPLAVVQDWFAGLFVHKLFCATCHTNRKAADNLKRQSSKQTNKQTETKNNTLQQIELLQNVKGLLCRLSLSTQF